MRNRSSILRRRPSQTTEFVADASVGEVGGKNPSVPKDPAAVSLGKKGGKIGGPARAARLSAAQRSEIAKKAARARWGGK